MCVFLQNQNFQKHTEHMMGVMAEGGQQAAARLLHVNASLSQQVRELRVWGGLFAGDASQSRLVMHSHSVGKVISLPPKLIL